MQGRAGRALRPHTYICLPTVPRYKVYPSSARLNRKPPTPALCPTVSNKNNSRGSSAPAPAPSTSTITITKHLPSRHRIASLPSTRPGVSTHSSLRTHTHTHTHTHTRARAHIQTWTLLQEKSKLGSSAPLHSPNDNHFFTTYTIHHTFSPSHLSLTLSFLSLSPSLALSPEICCPGSN
ncbi:uncharacterized protein K489DRAFT_249399 [Dissoconium aciculare CBS 342.82]|uniref:Uncharacterized protein n=1 Tax=Dissoconium aciculare CBS 342.82 TaxID=1314786 RepID=A0A6J3M0I1_9PEZI|nr:uncharacterized protein K489DRAFT_249399 [Dissoconium aciculare CBS 342.82]KAF1821526.1 hypothetical protein K489DRAFT_249399 [Dissoconium aciculare CBS 342.82]